MGVISKADFDRSTFFSLSMGYGIPLLLITILWFFLLIKFFEWRPFLNSKMAISNYFNAPLDSGTFKFYHITWWVIFSLPFLISLVFGIHTAVAIKPALLGIIISMSIPTILLLITLYMNYQKSGYSRPRSLLYTLALCLFLLIGLTLAVVFLMNPLSWMGCGYVLLWPSLLVFAIAFVSKRRHIVPATEISQATFNDDYRSIILNYVRGDGKISNTWIAIVLFSSLVFHGLFVSLFYNSEDHKATVSTASASFIVDIVLILLHVFSAADMYFFYMLMFAYALKVFAVSFSRRFWFIGHGIIYMITSTFLLYKAISDYYLYSQNRPDQVQNQEDLTNEEAISKICSDKKTVNANEYIISGVCWFLLTLLILIELWFNWNTNFESVFIKQRDIVIATMVFSIVFALAFAGLVIIHRNKGVFTTNSTTMISLSLILMLIFSIMFYSFSLVPSFQYTAFLVFAVFILIMIISIIKYNNPQYQIMASIKSYFDKTSDTNQKILFYSVLLLVILSLVLLGISFVKNVGFAGVVFIVFSSGITCFVLFCKRFMKDDFAFSTKEVIYLSISGGVFAITTFAVYSVMGWTVAFFFFSIVMQIIVLVLAILKIRNNHWQFKNEHYYLISATSISLIIMALISMVMDSNGYVHSILAFIYFLIFVVTTVYYLYQRNEQKITLISYVLSLSLALAFIVLIIYLIAALKSTFIIVTILFGVSFVMCIFGVITIIGTSSSTDVVVFSDIMFPVLRFTSGKLSEIKLFTYFFFGSFVSLWIWGLAGSVFFIYYQFGCLSLSLSIAGLGFIGLSLIYHFDDKTMNALDYAPRVAFQRAYEVASSGGEGVVCYSQVEDFSVFTDITEFRKQVTQDYSARFYLFEFTQTLKAQLYITFEVEFDHARTYLYEKFKDKYPSAIVLKREGNWMPWERKQLLQLYIKFKETDPDEVANKEYLEFIRKQEEERQKNLNGQIDMPINNDPTKIQEDVEDEEERRRKQEELLRLQEIERQRREEAERERIEAENRIKQIEEERIRRMEEERIRREEEERIRLESERRQQEELERRRREEEEQKRLLEEEKLRLEALERKRIEEARIQRELEEKRLREEEERRLNEEARRRREEEENQERIQREEEERKKQVEIARKKREEEERRRREEEEKRLKAEEARRKQEQEQRIREEAERKRREEEERKRQQDEERRRKEEERRLKLEEEDRKRKEEELRIQNEMRIKEEAERKKKEAEEELRKHQEEEERRKHQDENRSRCALELEEIRALPTSPYSTQVINCLTKNSQFNDGDFHPHKKIREGSEIKFTDTKWNRVETIQKTMLEDIAPEKTLQGAIGDCYLIAAMVSLSKDPDAIWNMFEQPIIHSAGISCVKFYLNGQITKVYVDTLVPCYSYDKIPIYCHFLDETCPYWPAIVEKAWAKLNGSYTAIIGGHSTIAFYRLTGCFPILMGLEDPDTLEKIKNGQLWKQIFDWNKNGNYLCAGSKNGSDTEKNAKSIVLGHAYSILDVIDYNNVHLLKIRNTWGETEWTGDWSDNSPKWTPQAKTALGWNKKDDGVFFMTFKDFTMNFDTIYAGIKLTGWNKYTITTTFKSGQNVNCGVSQTAERLPQWRIEFSGPTQMKGIAERSACSSGHSIAMKQTDTKYDFLYVGDLFFRTSFILNTTIDSWEWNITEKTNMPWSFCPYRRPASDNVTFYLQIYTDKPITITPL